MISKLRRKKMIKVAKVDRFQLPRTRFIMNPWLLSILYAKKIPLLDVAKAINVNITTLHGWVYEGMIPLKENMKKLEEFLGVTAKEMFPIIYKVKVIFEGITEQGVLSRPLNNVVDIYKIAPSEEYVRDWYNKKFSKKNLIYYMDIQQSHDFLENFYS